MPTAAALIVPPIAVRPAPLPKEITAPELAEPLATKAKRAKFLSKLYLAPNPTKLPPKPTVEQLMGPFNSHVPAALFAYCAATARLLDTSYSPVTCHVLNLCCLKPLTCVEVSVYFKVDVSAPMR